MIPALREVFSDVYVTEEPGYTSALCEQIAPEYLIAEYVERYSHRIKDIDFLINDAK